MSLSINLLTPNYPSSSYIERGAFVEALVEQWIELGTTVNVVAPTSIRSHTVSIGQRNPNKNVFIAGSVIQRPIYLSLSNKTFFNFSSEWLTNYFFAKACIRTLEEQSSGIYYGKFLKSGGLAATLAKKKYGGWAFADMGESVFLSGMSLTDRKKASRIIEALDGIVCVSERLKREVLEICPDFTNIIVVPNDVDLSVFRPMSKIECRKELGLSVDSFYVIFVGHFNERKGPRRVLESLDRLPDGALGIFLGRGNDCPVGDRVSVCRSVSNRDLPRWLNAADVMVLPTLAEGHCNAINEALACGLPVITSSIDDMKSRGDAHLLRLVDPFNIAEISGSLKQLFYDKDLFQQLKNELLVWRLEMKNRKRRGEVIHDWVLQTIS